MGDLSNGRGRQPLEVEPAPFNSSASTWSVRGGGPPAPPPLQMAVAAGFFILTGASAMMLGVVIGRQNTGSVPPAGGATGNVKLVPETLWQEERDQVLQCKSDMDLFKEEMQNKEEEFLERLQAEQLKLADCEYRFENKGYNGGEEAQGTVFVVGMDFDKVEEETLAELKKKIPTRISLLLHRPEASVKDMYLKPSSVTLGSFVDDGTRPSTVTTVTTTGTTETTTQITAAPPLEFLEFLEAKAAAEPISGMKIEFLIGLGGEKFEGIHESYFRTDFDSQVRHALLQVLENVAGTVHPSVSAVGRLGVVKKEIFLKAARCESSSLMGQCGAGAGSTGSDPLILSYSCDKLCIESAKCDTFLDGNSGNCPTSGWTPKPYPAGIFCLNTECQEQQCCNPTCENIKCRSGWLKMDSAPVGSCGDHPCMEGDCCSEAAKCAAELLAGRLVCPDGYVRKEEFPDHCEGHTCQASECCTKPATCCEHDCTYDDRGSFDAGWVKKGGPVEQDCGKAKCSREQCCVEAATCADYKCTYDKQPKASAKRPTYCDDVFCTAEECCDPSTVLASMKCCCKKGECTSTAMGDDERTPPVEVLDDMPDSSGVRDVLCCKLKDGGCDTWTGYTHHQAENVCKYGVSCADKAGDLCHVADGWINKRNMPDDCGARKCKAEQCCEHAKMCKDMCNPYYCGDAGYKSNMSKYCQDSCTRQQCCNAGSLLAFDRI